MERMLRDLRHGARALTRRPGFTLVALLTLALGIGANTAIFSVVHGVLLRPLPYDAPHELVDVQERARSGGTMPVAWANFRDWREEVGSFDGLAAYNAWGGTVLGGDRPARAPLSSVSRDFWRVLAVSPVAGRLTTAEDHLEGAAPVVVVRADLAEELLGGVAGAVGRTVEVAGARRTVVGVAPRDFAFPARTRAWVPLVARSDSRTSHNWSVVGRLRDGATVERAHQEVDALMGRLAAAEGPEAGDDYLAVGARVLPLRDVVVGPARQPLWLLLAAAGFVLLVACTNLASMLLARASTRRREMAVRTALGAPRTHLVPQLLSESLILAMVGGGLGLAVAAGALRLLRELGSGFVPRMGEVALDGPVLVFTLLTAVGTALLFGLAPALRDGTADAGDALRSSRGVGDGGQAWRWNALVATEVALALVLLVGSGLLVRSFVRVLAQDPGVEAADVATTALVGSGVRYPDARDHVRLWDALLARVEAVPGVAAAGLLSSPPVGGGAANGRVALDGDPDKHGDALYLVTSAGTFEALDVPLLRGRGFRPTDDEGAPHVVVVSRSFVDRYWPGRDPLGRQVSGGGMDAFWDADPVRFGTVVGVVEDVRYRSLTQVGRPTVYWHYKQRPSRITYGGALMAEARSGDPSALHAPLRDALAEVDPDLTPRIRNLGDLVDGSVADRRFTLWVLGSFALLALVLAAVGIYGVVSYSTSRRTREMGIRLALGASPGAVRGLVLRGALGPVLVGLVAGVAGALALTRGLAALLFEVEPTDPATFAAVAAILAGVGVVASWIPARRGTAVDPRVTMRAE